MVPHSRISVFIVSGQPSNKDPSVAKRQRGLARPPGDHRVTPGPGWIYFGVKNFNFGSRNLAQSHLATDGSLLDEQQIGGPDGFGS